MLQPCLTYSLILLHLFKPSASSGFDRYGDRHNIDINATPPTSPESSDYEAAQAMIDMHLGSYDHDMQHVERSNHVDREDEWSTDFAEGIHPPEIDLMTGHNAEPSDLGYDPYAEEGSSSHDPNHWLQLQHSMPSSNNQISYNDRRESRERLFPALSWTHSIEKPKLRQIYKCITRSWPPNLAPSTRAKWDVLASKWLDKHRDVLEGIMKNDSDAWSHAIHWWTPRQILERSDRYGNRRTVGRTRRKEKTRLAWLAGEITIPEKDQIMSRLAAYWPGSSPAAIHSRLCTYARHAGQVHSPEVLLHGDNEAFARAADLIYHEVDNKAVRSSESGPSDMLHQSSETYGIMDANGEPVFMPYEPTQKRTTAERYNTGHSWYRDMSTDDIDYFHNMVAKHYCSHIKTQMKYRNFLLVNEYLERHPESLKRLREGDDYEAWKVAKETCVKQKYMEHPLVYPFLPQRRNQ